MGQGSPRGSGNGRGGLGELAGELALPVAVLAFLVAVDAWLDESAQITVAERRP